jgi:hypothetical protein
MLSFFLRTLCRHWFCETSIGAVKEQFVILLLEDVLVS